MRCVVSHFCRRSQASFLLEELAQIEVEYFSDNVFVSELLYWRWAPCSRRLSKFDACHRDGPNRFGFGRLLCRYADSAVRLAGSSRLRPLPFPDAVDARMTGGAFPACLPEIVLLLHWRSYGPQYGSMRPPARVAGTVRYRRNKGSR